MGKQEGGGEVNNREKIADAVFSYMKGLPEPNEMPESIHIDIYFAKSREKHVITLSKEKIAAPSAEGLVQLYHDICGDKLPRVRLMPERRKKAVTARLREHDIAQFEELFKKARASDFLCGKNDRGWCANFDWLINESNIAKVLEGDFDNRKTVQTTRAGTRTATSFDVDESLRKAMERSYGGKI